MPRYVVYLIRYVSTIRIVYRIKCIVIRIVSYHPNDTQPYLVCSIAKHCCINSGTQINQFYLVAKWAHSSKFLWPAIKLWTQIYFLTQGTHNMVLVISLILYEKNVASALKSPELRKATTRHEYIS